MLGFAFSICLIRMNVRCAILPDLPLTCVSIIDIVCSDYLFEQSVELAMIHMCMSLSVQSKCFKTIIWCVPFMFHYTDYQPPQLLHLYCCHMDFFSFFHLKMAKPDSSCIIMYIKSPHSCLYPKWLQRYGIKHIS